MTSVIGMAGVPAMAISGQSAASNHAPADVGSPLKRLEPGSKVAIISPASGKELSADDQSRILGRVAALGFVPVPAPNFGRTYAYLGGTDQQRADDVNWAFANTEIAGVMPVRGGYGCTRILSLLNYELIRKNPKILIGYSDITALAVAITQKTGLITYHGPVLESSDSEFSWRWMVSAITHGFTLVEFKNPVTESQNLQLRTLVSGVSEGELTGGNLTVLAAMCGTEYQLSSKGKIVFLEDIREAPYRIDRMLTQMRESGAFDGARGFVLGQWTDCDDPEKPDAWKVEDVVRDRIASLGVPVLAGAAIGHIRDKWTVPIGARARLDATEKRLRLV
ncbi:LD-carboxypeptidase [Kamptonema cortianum]|nr:LD-carboxypeptidase [Geitlerinema splendidum]MDK3162461.1 LD-carboxypeptidase [Kamptonema cortianum]